MLRMSAAVAKSVVVKQVCGRRCNHMRQEWETAVTRRNVAVDANAAAAAAARSFAE